MSLWKTLIIVAVGWLAFITLLHATIQSPYTVDADPYQLL
jgi:hypothetical protein